MAYIDPETGSLNLHVVYDGAPYSGKTSSLRTLGRKLEREVVTPEERDGRTTYFDWMEYQGGRCLGRPVHCRVVAVPGQPELAARRSTILDAADAIVFVADTTSEGFAVTLEHFENLRRRLRERAQDVPIVLQLNKRDRADALDLEASVARLDPDLRSVATVATDGEGVRTAFVFAVGEAIRGLRQSRQLYEARQSLFDTQEVVLPSPERLLEILAEAS